MVSLGLEIKTPCKFIAINDSVELTMRDRETTSEEEAMYQI